MQERYCLQMVACNGGCGGDSKDASNHVYSTEETICGTWIDGKPIHRKVLTMKLPTPPAVHRVSIDAADMQIHDIVHLYGGASGAYYVPASTYLASSDYFCAYYHRESKHLVTAYSDNYTSSTAYLIVEYTKA